MTEYNNNNNKDNSVTDEVGPVAELDTAGKALSDALGISFVILKVIMVVLIILFLVSGFRTVEPDEQALVLRFGKIHGTGEDRILDPGLHWIFPYPIDEIVKIPVAQKVNLAVESFWFPESYQPPLSLNPVVAGYCITRSEKQTETAAAPAGSDYNIVHSKWQLTYQIDDPERFFKNVYVEDVKPGQIYSDVLAKTVNPLLEMMFESAVITAMVNYTIDEAMFEQVATVTAHVNRLLQQNLEKTQSGIKVVSVQLTDITWPQQVNEAFWASIRASQQKGKIISEAQTYAQTTLNETAGQVAVPLLNAIESKDKNAEEEQLLWTQLVGTAQEKIADARAYRRKVVQTAKANADYLKEILPEYRKRPELVIQNIYQDAVEYVLDNTDEKIIIQPTEGVKGKEIRIQLNRDPKIKPKTKEEK